MKKSSACHKGLRKFCCGEQCRKIEVFHKGFFFVNGNRKMRILPHLCNRILVLRSRINNYFRAAFSFFNSTSRIQVPETDFSNSPPSLMAVKLQNQVAIFLRRNFLTEQLRWLFL